MTTTSGHTRGASSTAFAVIADTHVGLDEQSTQILATRERAVECADTLNRKAESAHVPLHYRVFVLCELDESRMWDWGLRNPDGYVMEYVNERAARDSVYGSVTLVRRRPGNNEWHEVHLDEGRTRQRGRGTHDRRTDAR